MSEGNDSRETADNPYALPKGTYLINDKGEIAYLVDPGINGTRTRADDGTEVKKFTAPKATLMAFITEGILQRKLPWTLVLLGASIVARAGVVRRSFAGVCGRRLSSALDIVAHFCRWPGALRCRQMGPVQIRGRR